MSNQLNEDNKFAQGDKVVVSGKEGIHPLENRYGEVNGKSYGNKNKGGLYIVKLDIPIKRTGYTHVTVAGDDLKKRRENYKTKITEKANE